MLFSPDDECLFLFRVHRIKEEPVYNRRSPGRVESRDRMERPRSSHREPHRFAGVDKLYLTLHTFHHLI